MPGGEGGVEYPLMRAPVGEVKRVLKILVFFVFLPLFLAPSCKPRDSNSNAAPALDLSAPAGFGATTISKTQIDLAWTNVALDALNYQIERSVDGGAFTPLTTLPAAATGFSDTPLTASTQYSYRIRAVNGGNLGPWTATVTANTVVLAQVTPAPDPGSMTSPSARLGHSAVYDPGSDKMYLFGGRTSPTTLTDEVWILDCSLATPGWTLATPAVSGPTPREGHSAILDGPHNRIIVFGGSDGSLSFTNELWALDLSSSPTLTWSLLTFAVNPAPPTSSFGPFARMGHTAIYDSAASRMIVYGGTDDFGPYAEVWELTLPAIGTPTWTNITPTTGAPTPALGWATSVYRSGPGVSSMILFGGHDTTDPDPPGGTFSNEIWELSLLGSPTWTLIPASGVPPVARSGHSAVLKGSRLTIFGGYTGTLSGELWQVDLAAPGPWIQVNLGAPAPIGARANHSAIFQTGASRMILFGGGSVPDTATVPGTPAFADVWAFDM